MPFSMLAAAVLGAGLAGAAAAQAPAPLQGDDPVSARAWGEANLDLEGWVYIGSSSAGRGTLLWYVADQPAPDSKFPAMREWLRSENARQPGSILVRTEIDCTSGRSREVERVFYAGNDLRGAATLVSDTPNAPMAAAPKGSITETMIRRSCRDGR